MTDLDALLARADRVTNPTAAEQNWPIQPQIVHDLAAAVRDLQQTNDTATAQCNALGSVLRKIQADWEAPIDEWDQQKWQDPDDEEQSVYDWTAAERDALRAVLDQTRPSP